MNNNKKGIEIYFRKPIFFSFNVTKRCYLYRNCVSHPLILRAKSRNKELLSPKSHKIYLFIVSK